MSSPPRLPRFYFALGGLTALLIFAVGMAAAWAVARISAPEAAASDLSGLYDEAWQVIEQDYYGKQPSPTERDYGAIKGSLATLGDPYTFFIEPEPANREQEQLQGRFGGIGATLELTEDGRVRLQPLIDRPAAKAGLVDGDILIAIDGQSIPQPANLDDVTALLRAPVGTVVAVTVLRGDETLDFEIERAEIELPSVTWRTLPELPNGGYIHIERFSGLTAKELAEAIAALRQQTQLSALVLDLRGNPGGLLDAAVEAAGVFVDGGPAVIERQANGDEIVHSAPDGQNVSDLRLAVLTDAGTASAAEILAGALRDRLGVPLIGEKTYGKGSIQRIHRLSDGSAIHVTFARWFTPAGTQIDGQGLQPDIIMTPDPAAATDLTLAEAIKQLAAPPTTP